MDEGRATATEMLLADDEGGLSRKLGRLNGKR